MLKVMVVDDRNMVCEGLRNLIPWADMDAKVVGQANDGSLALKLAQQEQPDLIITDIRMPVMDGLSLIKTVADSLPDTNFIILSAYDDFEYAQSAIRYNVCDYILKPIDHPKMAQIIGHVRSLSVRKRMLASMHDPGSRARLVETMSDALLFSPRLSEITSALIKSAYRDAEFVSVNELRNYLAHLISVLDEAIVHSGFDPKTLGISLHATELNLRTLCSREDLIRCVRNLFQAVVSAAAALKESRRNSIVGVLKEHIESQYKDPNLSVESLADRLNLTPNYVSMVFHDVTGDNLSGCLTRFRIEKAKERLRDSNDSVQMIAGMVGYVDPHYFARVFKKFTNLTPSQYRNLSLSQTEKAPRNSLTTAADWHSATTPGSSSDTTA